MICDAGRSINSYLCHKHKRLQFSFVKMSDILGSGFAMGNQIC